MRNVHRDTVCRAASVAAIAFSSVAISPAKAFAQPAPPTVVAPTPLGTQSTTRSVPVPVAVAGTNVALHDGLNSLAGVRVSQEANQMPTFTFNGPADISITLWKTVASASPTSPPGVLRYVLDSGVDDIRLSPSDSSPLSPTSITASIDSVNVNLGANLAIGSSRDYTVHVTGEGPHRLTIRGPGGFLRFNGATATITIATPAPPTPGNTAQNQTPPNPNGNGQQGRSVRPIAPMILLPHYSASVFGSVLPSGVDGVIAGSGAANVSYYIRLGPRDSGFELSIFGSGFYRHFGLLTSEFDAGANVVGGGLGVGVLRSFGDGHYLEGGLFFRGGVAPLSASQISHPTQTRSVDASFAAYGLSLHYVHRLLSAEVSATSGLIVPGSDLMNPLHVEARHRGIHVPWTSTNPLSLGASLDMVNFPAATSRVHLDVTAPHFVAMVRAGVPISRVIAFEAGVGADLTSLSLVVGVGVTVAGSH
ncbi:hypothetical protein HY990_07220 [Candidatus Micrarchaeota archaeon]|nr:hypothetical protein [Candidatus Micrarchaeota archaeon]